MNFHNIFHYVKAKRIKLEKSAPVNYIENEEGEGKEESGKFVNVNGGCSALTARVVLNGRRWPHRTWIPFRIRPHGCLRLNQFSIYAKTIQSDLKK